MSDDLPMGWNVANLKEIAQLINGDRGKNYPSKEALINQGVPFINAGHLVDGCIDFANMNYISNEHFQILGSGKVQSNDLIYCIRGSLGKIAIVEDVEEGAIASSLVILRPNENTFTKYLYYFLVSPLGKTEISKHDNGTAQPNLSSANVGFYQVPLPPRNEQRRIVDKLDRIGDRHRTARNELNHIPKLIARYKQAVLSAACSGKLTEDWRETNNISFNWERVKMAEIGYLGRGKSKHRPRNDSRLYGGIYPFIQTGDIAQSNGRIESHSQTYSEFGLSQSKLWEAGTVCITIAANIGDTAILSYPACFPDSVVGFVCDDKKCLPEFFKWSIDMISEDLESFAPATAQKNINLAILNDIELFCPPFEEQKEIVRRVEKMFEKIDRMEQEYHKAAKLCDRLEQATLAKAFRGELVPQDPDDEPASVLLEQVKSQRSKGKKGVKLNTSD